MKKQETRFIYPNPATNKVMVDFVPDNTSTLSITDLKGQLIKQQKLDSKLLTLDELQHGMYVFQLTNNKESYTEKVVIIK